jgi:hypothetical protein
MVAKRAEGAGMKVLYNKDLLIPKPKRNGNRICRS